MTTELQTKTPAAPLPALPLDAKTARIVAACGLESQLAKSICLVCQKSVLSMDSKRRAILYCSKLYRDIQTEIVDCTGFASRPAEPADEPEAE